MSIPEKNNDDSIVPDDNNIYLPLEIWTDYIFIHLTIFDIINLLNISKYYNKLIFDNLFYIYNLKCKMNKNLPKQKKNNCDKDKIIETCVKYNKKELLNKFTNLFTKNEIRFDSFGRILKTEVFISYPIIYSIITYNFHMFKYLFNNSSKSYRYLSNYLLILIHKSQCDKKYLYLNQFVNGSNFRWFSVIKYLYNTKFISNKIFTDIVSNIDYTKFICESSNEEIIELKKKLNLTKYNILHVKKIQINICGSLLNIRSYYNYISSGVIPKLVSNLQFDKLLFILDEFEINYNDIKTLKFKIFEKLCLDDNVLGLQKFRSMIINKYKNEEFDLILNYENTYNESLILELFFKVLVKGNLNTMKYIYINFINNNCFTKREIDIREIDISILIRVVINCLESSENNNYVEVINFIDDKFDIKNSIYCNIDRAYMFVNLKKIYEKDQKRGLWFKNKFNINLKFNTIYNDNDIKQINDMLKNESWFIDEFM